MRNSFIYYGIGQSNLLNALLNMSKDIDYISILTSNITKKATDLPKDYINYNILAGVGKNSGIISNKNSFEKLYDFHTLHKDWLFGYLSYDIKNELEELSSNNIDNFNADNLSFFIPTYVLLLKNDNLEIQTYSTKADCDKFVDSLDFSELPRCTHSVNLKARDGRQSYLEKVKKIKSYIKSGDIYEMNYCQEFFSNDVKISAESVFLELNQKMQTPFASFIKLKDKYILSASPERFLRKQADKILTQPIKGTIKRGDNILEDKKLKNELKISQKDISENVMIVDLVRNDLSIISKKDTVTVHDLCKVYSFKRVHQMITSISSEIDSNFSFTDVLKATFPMGSMTGAPKIRAMELIEIFEEFRRGVFSGAIGYITPQADFDFNVVIRTILYNLANNYLSIGVGGAITFKSNPIEEYNECIVKVKPIFETLNFKIND